MPNTRRSRSPSVTTPQEHSAHLHGSQEHIGLLHFAAALITVLPIPLLLEWYPGPSSFGAVLERVHRSPSGR